MVFAPQLWAVLIGVNTHHQRSLKGCINDVNSVEQYLKRYKHVNISKFVADHPFGRKSTTSSLSWPTHINITSKLKQLARKAKKGDSVLIHYSGHGTQYENPEDSKYNSDIALVLLDTRKRECYLRGVHLANLLKLLVEKGLFVTLVLDCCFSGSVTRGKDHYDHEIRGVEWDDSVSGNFPISREKVDRILDVLSDESRDASWRYNWLDTAENLNFTLVTACGPHEVARECYFEGKKHGKLSYYLLDSLEQLWGKNIVNCSLELLLGYLNIQLNKHPEKQTPMLRGDRTVAFLTRTRSEQTAYAYVTAILDSRISLNIGFVHGVCENNIYAASPFSSVDDISGNAGSASIQLEITAVRSLSSDAKVITRSAISSVQVGWKAKLIKSSSQPIQININCKGERKADLTKAIKNSRYPQLLASDGSKKLPCYSLIISESGKYEIQNDQGHRVHDVPSISQQNSRAIRLVVLLLEHIAQFEHVKSLQNTKQTCLFEKSVVIEVRDARDKLLEDSTGNANGCTVKVNHKENIQVKIKNACLKSLYVWIYNMNCSSWQIDYSDCFVVEPKDRDKRHSGIVDRNVIMKVPSNQKRCKDMIKILVTTTPTSVAQLRLPKLQERREFRQLDQMAKRDSDDTIYEESDDRGDIAASLMTMLATVKTTQKSRGDDSGEEWSIHTYCMIVSRD